MEFTSNGEAFHLGDHIIYKSKKHKKPVSGLLHCISHAGGRTLIGVWEGYVPEPGDDTGICRFPREVSPESLVCAYHNDNGFVEVKHNVKMDVYLKNENGETARVGDKIALYKNGAYKKKCKVRSICMSMNSAFYTVGWIKTYYGSDEYSFKLI